MGRYGSKLFLVAALILAAGCAGGDDGGDGGDATATPTPAPSETPVAPTPSPTGTPTAVTFEWIRSQVLVPNCWGSGCHGAASDAPMLEYDDVVNAPTMKEEACDGRIRVVPGDLEASTLYGKLTDTPPCGERMPYETDPLPDELIEAVRLWILDGAPEGAP